MNRQFIPDREIVLSKDTDLLNTSIYANNLVNLIKSAPQGHGFDTDELKRQGFDIEGYDSCYRANYPEGKFNTIICIYVLNVLEPYAQAEVMWEISNLLASGGTVYYAVRRDLKEEGFRWHAIHKQYTYQCNVILPYKSVTKNKGFEIYQK